MLALRILLHAMRQLLPHNRAVLSLGLPALILGLSLDIFGASEFDLGGPEATMPDGYLVLMLARSHAAGSATALSGSAANALLYLLLAVGWHRHVLLGEQPRLLGSGLARQMAGYALAAFGLTALYFTTSVAANLALAELWQRPGYFPVMSMIRFLINVAVATFILRLAIALPGIALRQSEPWKQAWIATRRHASTLIALATVVVIMPVGSLVIVYVLASGMQVGWLGFAVISASLSWLGVLISISVLTTLWGHFVEGRALR